MLVCAAQSLRGQIRKGFPTLPPPLKLKYHLSPFKNLVKGELEALGRKGWGGAGRKRKTSQRRRITICPWRQMCGPRTLATRVGVWDANGLLLQEAPRIGIQPVPAQGSPMSPLSLQEIRHLVSVPVEAWPWAAAGPPGAHFPPHVKRRGAPGKQSPGALGWRESLMQRAS